MPVVCVIGGPNGAGKTTIAYQLPPDSLCRQFVNADEIAAGLSPFAHETTRVQAGRLMLRRISFPPMTFGGVTTAAWRT